MCEATKKIMMMKMKAMMMIDIMVMMLMAVKLRRIDRGSSPDGVFPLHAFTISPH